MDNIFQTVHCSESTIHILQESYRSFFYKTSFSVAKEIKATRLAS